MVVRRVRVASLVLTLSVGAACNFDAGIGPGYRCGEGDRCPDGQSCVAGYCVTSSGIDGGIDGNGPAARCGTMTLLQDDFEDSLIGPFWYPWDDAPSATFAMNGGDAVIAFTAGAADAWAGFDSSVFFDLTGGELDVDIAQIGGVTTVAEVRAPDGTRAQIYAQDGLLSAGVFGTAGAGTRREIPFVAADHRYWRLREAGGTLYWETSPDRLQWDELHAEAVPFPPEHVRAVIAAGGQLATASEARFADINGAAPAGLAYCPAADLVDDFEAPPLDPLWDPWTDAGCTIVENGAFTIDFDPGTGDAWCGATGRHLYDLRESTYVVEVSGAPDAPMFVTEVIAVEFGANGNNVLIKHEEGSLHTHQAVDDSDVDSANVPYDATAHRFWRIRGEGGRVYLDTSPDGTTWTNRLDAAAQIDLSRVELLLSAGHYDLGPGTPQTVRFESANAP